MMIRLAFEDDFFHPVTVTLYNSCHPGIQRGSLGQAADGLDEILAKLLLIFGYLLRRFTLLVLLLPVLEFLSGEPAQVMPHPVPRRHVIDLFRQYTQIFLAKSRSVKKQSQAKNHFN